jgi:hypothetical protein
MTWVEQAIETIYQLRAPVKTLAVERSVGEGQPDKYIRLTTPALYKDREALVSC